MVYEWGGKPSYSEEVEASEDDEFQKGEWGRIVNHVFQTHTGIVLTTEQEFADLYANELKSKGADVKYISVTKSYTPYVRFTVNECVFVGDPIPVIVILGLMVLAGIFMVLYRPAVFKLLGISPVDALVSDFGIVIVLGALIVLLVVFKGKG